MSISFSHQQQIECPQCKRQFSSELWILIDATERPDLLALCHKGTIFHVTCPAGHLFVLDRPLLVHNAPQKWLFLVNGEWLRGTNALGVFLKLLSDAIPDANHRGYLREAEAPFSKDLPDALQRQTFLAVGPELIQAVIREVSLPTDPSDLEPRAARIRRLLEEFRYEDEPSLWATLQGLLGNCFLYNTQSENESTNLEHALTAYESALKVFTQEVNPIHWAGTQHNIGATYRIRIQGDRTENLERAIEALEAALTVRTRETTPLPWALTQLNLGIAYEDRKLGSWSENLEFALQAYEAAITVLTPELQAVETAEAYDRLASIYYRRPTGQKSTNIERAIELSLAVLKIYSPESYSQQWTRSLHNLGTAYRDRIEGETLEKFAKAIAAYNCRRVQHNLGMAYRERLEGERAENLEKAIEAYNSALTMTSAEQTPLEWAATQSHLGVTYSLRIHGEREENLKLAIAAIQAALTVYGPENTPVQWAEAQYNLAQCYASRLTDDDGKNVELAISGYKAALTVFSRDASPEKWAQTQFELARALGQLNVKQAQDLELQIYCLESALTVFTPDSYRDRWAATKLLLGAVYYQAASDLAHEQRERSGFFESAIEALQNAATVYTRQVSPAKWTFIQRQLGMMYQQRLQGSESENVEKARTIFEEVLSHDTTTISPSDSADMKYRLGSLYSTRDYGEYANNIEKAIQYLEQALTVFNSNGDVKRCAEIQSSLGTVYRERQLGNRANNIETAIKATHSALTFFTRDAYPQEWAEAQDILGAAYFARIVGSRKDNLEQAIDAFEASLTVYTREASPEAWALGQMHLGSAYRERIVGEKADNLERALEASEAALTVLTKETSPKSWAATQQRLANAYRSRIRGNWADNVERAITASNAALTVYTRETHPRSWAITQHVLATCYFARIRGDRAENFERAIQASEGALSVFTRDTDPRDWALAQQCLGSAYWGRLIGDSTHNIENAIRAFKAALTVFTLRDYPDLYAGTQVGLAHAYVTNPRDMREENQRENIELAIAAYESALQVFTQASAPVDWAQTQMSLASAYYRRMEGNRAENVEKAIEMHTSASTVYTREAFPREWAMIQRNLALCYQHRLRGNKDKNLENAVTACEASLSAISPDVVPTHTREAATLLALLKIEKGAWSDAYSALQTAIRAAENLYTAAVSEGGKAAEMDENTHLYRQVVDVCLRLNPPRVADAFLYAEEGRSRILRDQLGTYQFLAPKNVPRDVLDKEEELLRTARNVQTAITTSVDAVTRQQWVDEAFATRQQLQVLWNELISSYAAHDYVALRRGEKLQWQDVQSWLATQDRRIAFLKFVVLPSRLVAFIIRKQDVEPRVFSARISIDELTNSVGQFFRELHAADHSKVDSDSWAEGLESLLIDIMPFLTDVELLYIIPDAGLHYLPLHALKYEGNPLITYCPVVYAPSMGVVLRLSQFDTRTTTDGLGKNNTLVVGNPTGDLPFSQVEAEEVATRFGVAPLLGAAATKEHVLSEMNNKALIHISSHAFFASADPLNSGIVLSGDEILTAREVMTRELEADLLVLSGCETGVQGYQKGNELGGFARSYLYAGVSTLALSLWAVNDYASATLMSSFYNHLYDSAGRKKSHTCDALSAAMKEVRSDFPHAYYWAPFVLFGDWR